MEALIDAIYRLGRCKIGIRSACYKTGTIAAVFPFGSSGTGGVVGRLASAIAQALVLSATSGTPAASSPASITGNAICSPGYEIELLFSSKLREVPVQMDFLYDGSKWFS